MQMTWGECQVLALQKMFLNNVPITVDDLPRLRTDRKYAIYLNACPAIANEGLIRLMSVGTPLVKKYKITHNVPEIIYDYKSHDSVTIIGQDYVVEGNASKSYYFEISDTATIEIQKYTEGKWTVIDTINHVANVPKGFEVYKGLIDNADSEPIRIVFKGDEYLYEVRNIALYNISFRLEEDVFEYTLTQKYNLADLIKDFYQIISVEYEKPGKVGTFDKYYLLEGDKTLVIDTDIQGNFIITYKAYPDKITLDTDDNYKFKMPAEMIALLPLYIASELYKDDDISVATIYRNQFELSISNLKPIAEPIDFADTNGWL